VDLKIHRRDSDAEGNRPPSPDKSAAPSSQCPGLVQSTPAKAHIGCGNRGKGRRALWPVLRPPTATVNGLEVHPAGMCGEIVLFAHHHLARFAFGAF